MQANAVSESVELNWLCHNNTELPETVSATFFSLLSVAFHAASCLAAAILCLFCGHSELSGASHQSKLHPTGAD